MSSGQHEEGITDFFERQREHRPTLDPERAHGPGNQSPPGSGDGAALSPRADCF
jgi:hypothetical protein